MSFRRDLKISYELMFFIEFHQIIWAILCIYSLIHDSDRNTVYLRERTLQSLFCRSAVHFHQDDPEVMTGHNTLTKHHKGICKTMKNIIKSWLIQQNKKRFPQENKFWEMSGQTFSLTEESGNHFQHEMSVKAV